MDNAFDQGRKGPPGTGNAVEAQLREAHLNTRAAKPKHDIELIAQGERLLNRVLGYQAAMAVHQLKDDLGIDVEELNLTVLPISSDAVGAYRVVCTIVRASAPEPIVLELIVDPEKAVTSAKRSA